MTDEPSDLVLAGRGGAPGRVCAPVVRNDPGRDDDEIRGRILLGARSTPEDAGRVIVAGGLCTLGGAPMSHVALLAHEFGIPAVTLAAHVPARIVSTAGEAILSFSDVVGEPHDAVLNEGDVVLLDGYAGSLTVPGGASATRRGAAREIHDALRRFESDPSPGLDRMLPRSLPPGGARFIVVAALRFGLVSAGERSRNLVEELLRRDAGTRAWLDELRRGWRQEAAVRGRRAQAAVEMTDDPEEPGRRLAELERRLAPIDVRLRDLGDDPGIVAKEVDAVRVLAGRRRKELHGRVLVEVRDVLTSAGSARPGPSEGLFRLIRRARAAGVETPLVAALENRARQAAAEDRAVAGNRIIIRLDDGPANADVALVGGKAAGLLRAIPFLPDGCESPAGFVVTTAGFLRHLAGPCGERLRAASAAAAPEEMAGAARAAILDTPVPQEIRDAIRSGAVGIEGDRYAVRSSSTVEDGPDAGLAGQFDSFLGVRGVEAVIDRVRWVWASLWNERAIRVLAARGATPRDARQAVIVQRSIETRVAGVLRTRDAGGSPDAVLINAHWGLGAGISQGEFAGDLYWVRRTDGSPIAFDLAAESGRVVPSLDGTGTLVESLPHELSGRPCLGESELRRLAELARDLEGATGRTHDVEFGFGECDELYVFQVRRLARARG